MRSIWSEFTPLLRMALAVALLVAVRAAGDTTDDAPVMRDAALHERQAGVRERILRLEGLMLKLAGELAEREPEKAERLRDALDHVGRQQVKARVDRLVTLLREARLSEADSAQEALLADFEALLAVLTSTESALDRQRERREKLEAFKRTVRQLMDEQMQHLYRTQHARRQLEQEHEGQSGVAGEDGEQAHAPPSEAVQEMLRQLEQLQRQTQQKTAQLGRDLKSLDTPERPAPGREDVERAAEAMRNAAEALGREQPGDAAQSEEAALEQLQRALDELDESLRQVRRQEMEETLTALESRLRALLNGERQVRERAGAVAAAPQERWTRVERLQLEETAERQAGLAEDATTMLRILLDEGTTVAAPALVRQLVVDMELATERLAAADVSPLTIGLLDDIIALLEEMLEAVERKRDELAQQFDQEGEQGGPPPPLLSGSAELKLLRSAQVRINDRTAVLGSADLRDENGRTAGELERLSGRQAELAELALRMHERN